MLDQFSNICMYLFLFVNQFLDICVLFPFCEDICMSLFLFVNLRRLVCSLKSLSRARCSCRWVCNSRLVDLFCRQGYVFCPLSLSLSRLCHNFDTSLSQICHVFVTCLSCICHWSLSLSFVLSCLLFTSHQGIIERTSCSLWQRTLCLCYVFVIGLCLCFLVG